MAQQVAIFLREHGGNRSELPPIVIRIRKVLNFDPGQIQDEVRYGQFIGVLRRQKDERRVLIKGRTEPPNVLKLSVSRLNRLLFRGKIPARNCVEVHEKKSWLKGSRSSPILTGWLLRRQRQRAGT